MLLIPILVASTLVLLFVLGYRHLRLLRSISRLIKVLQFLNVSPEELLPVIFHHVRRDPEWRKVCGVVGTRKFVVVFHPETVEPLLRSNVNVSKVFLYDVAKPLLGLGLVTSDGERWRRMRRMLTPAFHFDILERSVEIFNKCTVLDRICLVPILSIYKVWYSANGTEQDLPKVSALGALGLSIVSGNYVSKWSSFYHPRLPVTPVLQKKWEAFKNEPCQDSQEGRKVLDLTPYVSRCTLDILMESAMGISLDIQHSRASEFLSSVTQCFLIFHHRMFSPWLWPEWIYNLTARKKSQDRHVRIIRGLARKVIQKNRAMIESGQRATAVAAATAAKERLPFLELLMAIRATSGQQGLSDEEIEDEVSTFLVAGFETTANTVSWTLLLLANHPEEQDKLVNEQRELFGDVPEADVLPDQLAKMIYLECCIKEAMRLYPGAPIIGRQLAEELVVDGIPVEKGCSLFVFVSALHRNPMVWEAPDEFKPERFLPDSRSAVERHPLAYIPFSAGPRNCIGQKFALMEVKTVLSKLLRKVEVVKVDGVEDVKPVIGIVTSPKDGIRASFKKRSME